MRRLLCVACLLAASPFASAGMRCLPLASYEVAGVTAANVPLRDAMGMLVTGTPWQVTVSEELTGVRMSYRNVAGPLDKVMARAISQAGEASGQPMSSVMDASRCLITVSTPPPVVTAPAVVASATPPPASSTPVAHASATGTAVTLPLPAKPAPVTSGVLHAGDNLSAALEAYAKRGGWSLRWNIDSDYVLDADIPLPQGDVIQGITWVVRTYQAQGGLEGVVPRFAKGNHVVVIESMDVREQESN